MPSNEDAMGTGRLYLSDGAGGLPNIELVVPCKTGYKNGLSVHKIRKIAKFVDVCGRIAQAKLMRIFPLI